jgi:hypothetical protein
MIKLRSIKWAGHVIRMGEVRNAYKIVVGRADRKKPYGGPRRRWEDNIRIDIREIWWKVWTGFTCLRIGASGGLS